MKCLKTLSVNGDKMKLILTMLALSVALFAGEACFTNDYKEAIKKAKLENKDVYMLITSETCGWCRKFELITLNNKETMDMLKKSYVLLHVTRDKDYIPEHFTAKRVPKHYFLTKDEKEIYSFLGYWNPEDFRSFLSDIESRKKKMKEIN